MTWTRPSSISLHCMLRINQKHFKSPRRCKLGPTDSEDAFLPESTVDKHSHHSGENSMVYGMNMIVEFIKYLNSVLASHTTPIL